MSFSEPFLTIVIPYHNREKFLPATLNSLSCQENPETRINIIIVNNNSTDNSYSIVEYWINNKMPTWLSVIHTEEKELGASFARNRGLQLCETRWIMFFDSDDIMQPQHLKNVVNTINTHSEAQIIHWNYIETENGKKVRKVKTKNFGQDINVVIHGIWATARYAVRTDFIKKCGAWNNELKVWDDWELSIRMLLKHPATYDCKNIYSVLVNIHNQSLTSLFYPFKVEELIKALTLSAYEASKSGNKNILRLIIAKRASLAALLRNTKNREKSMEVMRSIKMICPTHYPFAVFCYRWQCVFRHGLSYPLRLFEFFWH